jgi:nitrogen-specific signal transduction histidine kinase
MGRARRHGTELLAGIRLAMQLIRNAQPVHSDAPVIKIIIIKTAMLHALVSHAPEKS